MTLVQRIAVGYLLWDRMGQGRLESRSGGWETGEP